jgi:hypothetical protein
MVSEQEITVKLKIDDTQFQNTLIQMEVSMAAFADRLITIVGKISDTVTQMFTKMKEESSKFKLGDILGGLLQTDPGWYIMAINGITKIGFAFQSVIGGAATLTEAMSYLFPTFTPFLVGGSVLLGIGALALALYGIISIIGEISKQAKAASGNIASINNVSEAQYTVQYWEQELQRMEKARNDAKLVNAAKELQGHGIGAVETAMNADQNNLRIEWTPDFEKKYQNALNKLEEARKKLNELMGISDSGNSKPKFSYPKQNFDYSKSNKNYPPTWEDYVAQIKQQKQAEAYQRQIDQGKIPGEVTNDQESVKASGKDTNGKSGGRITQDQASYRDFTAFLKTMTDDIKKASKGLGDFGEGLRSIKDKAINNLTSRMPILSSAMQGAEMGSAAGPWGAIIGAIVGILMESETFKTLLEMTNSILQIFADTLGKILEPFIPIIQILNDTLAPILMVIGTILGQVLKPILQAIFPILKLFGIAVALVSLGIAKFYNAIANAINWLLGWLGVHIATIDESGLEEALQAIKDATWDSVEAKAKETKTTKEATEALRNVPEGFKIALTRFNVELPKYATGGYVPYTPGGRVVSVAENEGEWILNGKQMATLGNGGGSIIINGDVYGWDDFKRKVNQAQNENSRSRGLALNGVTF